MTPTAAPFRLFFFFKPGCGYCEEAKPIVDRFAQAHPEALVMKINGSRRSEILGFEPEGFPAYLLVATHGGQRFDHVGLLSAELMEEALAEIRPDDEDQPGLRGRDSDDDEAEAGGDDDDEGDEPNDEEE